MRGKQRTPQPGCVDVAHTQQVKVMRIFLSCGVIWDGKVQPECPGTNVCMIQLLGLKRTLNALGKTKGLEKTSKNTENE